MADDFFGPHSDGAVTTRPAPSLTTPRAGHAPTYFADCSSVDDEDGTQFAAEWANMVVANLDTVRAASGATVTPGADDMLLEAILALIADAITTQAGSVDGFVARAGDTMTGDLAIAKANPSLILDKALAGQAAALLGRKSGVDRWRLLLGDATAEGGANTGSLLQLLAYSDAGAQVAAALTGRRTDGRLLVAADPIDALGIATKGYVDARPRAMTLIQEFACAGASSFTVTGLEGYRELLIVGRGLGATTNLAIRVSSDGGTTWDATAAHYDDGAHVQTAAGGTTAGYGSSNSYGFDLSAAHSLEATIREFNQAKIASIDAAMICADGSNGVYGRTVRGTHNVATARDALKILAPSALSAGILRVYGA